MMEILFKIKGGPRTFLSRGGPRFKGGPNILGGPMYPNDAMTGFLRANIISMGPRQILVPTTAHFPVPYEYSPVFP